MKQGKSLEELARELDRQNTVKRDFIVPARGIEMTRGNDGLEFLMSSSKGSECFGASSHFHHQVATTLDIPQKYYQLMYEKNPDLLVNNVNSWLDRSDKRHTVRLLDGRGRAFLSDRYRMIDNYQVASAVLPIIGQIEGAKIESCEVTDHHMYLKVVNPRLEAEVFPGDIVQSGICISNSEVGLGAVKVVPLLYRLVCSNGMVVNDLASRNYHIGRAEEREWELFSDETRMLDDAAFMAKISDIVRSTIDAVRFEKVVQTLRDAREHSIEGNIIDVVDLAAKELTINKDEQGSVLTHLIAGGDLSKYGLANAVTQASKTSGSYERATELEAMGWNIIKWTGSTWKRLNAA